MPIRLTLTILIALFGFVNVGAAQQTWWVNNQGELNDADFSSLADAIAAASAGDTIMLYPSNITYSGTVNKPLHIYGAGYSINSNYQVDGSIGLTPSTIAAVSFQESARGSSLNSVQAVGNASAATNDVLFNKCLFTSNINWSGDSIKFQKCYFQSAGGIGSSSDRAHISNCIFSNQYFSFGGTNMLVENSYIRKLQYSNQGSGLFLSNYINEVSSHTNLPTSYQIYHNCFAYGYSGLISINGNIQGSYNSVFGSAGIAPSTPATPLLQIHRLSEPASTALTADPTEEPNPTYPPAC